MEFFSGSISSVTDTINNTVSDFYTFLIDKNIIQLGTAFIISAQINQLASKFIENIISPVIKRVVGGEEESLKGTTFTILGIKFEIGDFIAQLLKFLIMMIILYYMFKIIKK